MTNLDWVEILDRLANFSTSVGARERLLALAPLKSETLALQNFSETEQAMEILALGQRPFMESLDLFSTWQQRLSKNATLKTIELKDLRHFCLEVLALSEVIKDHQSAWTTTIKLSLMNATEPLSAIDQIMTAEGDIRTDASETLYQLYQEKNTVVHQTQRILDRLIRQHEMEPVLQDRYVTNREGRWVLPVRSGKQHSLDGIIHASSQSKQTVFMEPKEIIPLNNRLRQVEVDIEEEVERLLRQLSEYLMTLLPDFLTTQQTLLTCDIRFAQAQLAIHIQASACVFDQTQIMINGLKHPMLLLGNVEVIANSIALTSQRRILLLSGPNAGGKTILLKSVGLAAQMARCGLLISATPGARLPFFDHIHVAVGDAQSVDQHLSTFAAHLKILNQATQSKGPTTLLLIDEICGSTDPEEGTALARAFLKNYAKNQIFGVVTSHLGPLKLGWDPNSGVVNGSLEYDSKSGQPTYHFLMGVAGQSLALQTARRVGINPEILDDAVQSMSPEFKKYHMVLNEVETMKDELRKLRDQTVLETREANKEKSKYAALVQNFEAEKNKMLEQALKQAERKIETLIEHTQVDDVFRRHERLGQIKSELPEIMKTSPRTGLHPKIESAEDFAKAFPPGSKVFATSIGRDAVVQGLPNSKGEIPVLSNSMRLMVPWAQLKSPQQASNPTVDLVRRKGEVSSPLDQDRNVDVRGRAMDEALNFLESQLDTAVLNQESRIKIIHGHGTDTLKKGIRGYLSRSVYVKKWKAGTPETGGDGVTWAELRD